MKELKAVMKRFGLNAIYGIDFETYYDNDFSLRKMATTEYIVDSRFETQLVAVQKESWAKPRVLTGAQFKAFASTVDWSKTGFLAHHTQFDGLIASHHFGVKPAFYFDTLSMAKPIMPVQVGGSLDRLAKAFGFKGKVWAQALTDVKGKRFKEFTKAELKQLMVYAGDDIDQTWGIFNKMLPYTPLDELRLIDLTMKMYAQPTLKLDKSMLEKVYADTVAHKAELMEKLGVDRATLMSNEMFAEFLRHNGVEPPTKISKTTGKVALALSKQDLEFKKLLESDNDIVACAVAARLGVKSTILETRARRMIGRSHLPAQPIYLNYWGAKTGRWSGGDSSNWQNMSRGSDLRKAILAPPGHSLVIADLAQIEARINAWFAGQQNIVDAFADKQDVYKIAASLIYNKPVDQITKDERFVGKCCVLALGYGAGAVRFGEMLRVGALGPPIDISDSLARDIHTGWRRANPFIVANWKRQQNNAQSAFLGQQQITDGVLTYDGQQKRGLTWLPGGTYIRYDDVEATPDGMQYAVKARRLKDGSLKTEYQKLYGGLIVENNTQALARRVIAEQILEIASALPNTRLAMTTHDEVVLVVPNRSANKALQGVTKIMSTPPSWASNLPLAVDAHVSSRYDK